MQVELIYFQGCPNVEQARDNLHAAMQAAGVHPPVKEWDRDAPDAPPRVRRYPSPTVLVNGRDVCGDTGGSEQASCRALGASGVDVIRAALSAS